MLFWNSPVELLALGRRSRARGEMIRIPCSASAGRSSRSKQRASALALAERPRSRIASICSLGDHPVGAAGVDAGLELIVEVRHPHHEELVEVRLPDRAELDPLEQRHRGVLGELEHPVVEVEPGELAVEVERGVLEVGLALVRPGRALGLPEAPAGGLGLGCVLSRGFRVGSIIRRVRRILGRRTKRRGEATASRCRSPGSARNRSASCPSPPPSRARAAASAPSRQRSRRRERGELEHGARERSASGGQSLPCPVHPTSEAGPPSSTATTGGRWRPPPSTTWPKVSVREQNRNSRRWRTRAAAPPDRTSPGRSPADVHPRPHPPGVSPARGAPAASLGPARRRRAKGEDEDRVLARRRVQAESRIARTRSSPSPFARRRRARRGLAARAPEPATATRRLRSGMGIRRPTFLGWLGPRGSWRGVCELRRVPVLLAHRHLRAGDRRGPGERPRRSWRSTRVGPVADPATARRGGCARRTRSRLRGPCASSPPRVHAGARRPRCSAEGRERSWEPRFEQLAAGYDQRSRRSGTFIRRRPASPPDGRAASMTVARHGADRSPIRPRRRPSRQPARPTRRRRRTSRTPPSTSTASSPGSTSTIASSSSPRTPPCRSSSGSSSARSGSRTWTSSSWCGWRTSTTSSRPGSTPAGADGMSPTRPDRRDPRAVARPARRGSARASSASFARRSPSTGSGSSRPSARTPASARSSTGRSRRASFRR